MKHLNVIYDVNDVVGVIDGYPDAYEDRLTELYPGR